MTEAVSAEAQAAAAQAAAELGNGPDATDEAKAAAAAAAKPGDGSTLDIESKEDKEKKPEDEKKPEVNEEALQDGVAYEYNDTGDTSLNVALNWIGGLGFSAKNPAVVAAMKGDFKPLESALQSLGSKAKGYESYLKLGQEAFTRKTAAVKDAAAAAEAIVHNAVGGKEVWLEVQKFVQANADDNEKAHINAAFKAGGLQAGAVAKTLLEAYQRQGGKAKPVVGKDAPAGGSQGSGALSPKEYAAAVSALARKTRGSIDNLPEYAALKQRASAYRG